MKIKYLALSVMAVTSLFVAACNDSSASKDASAVDTSATTNSSAKVTAESSFDDKVSYSIGVSVGTYLATIQKEQGEFIGKLNQELITQGFIDALHQNTALSEEEITKTLTELDSKVRQGLEEKLKQDALATLEEGKKFLEENAKKDGVKTTESGLQYKITKEGTGKSPKVTDEVRVTYKGTDIHGNVFDESQDPITFPLANIIPGWVEGLQLMKEGGEATLYIPSDLAYGENGAGEIIKPNSTLIFEVKLVEVINKEAEQKAESKK